MSEPIERTSYDAYLQKRKELGEAVPDPIRVVKGDNRNVEYRKELTLTYLLTLNGELLRRIEELEHRLTKRASDDE
jgi:hypothetical protein